MNEFTWSTEDAEGYKGHESLNIACGITEDGRYEIRNLSNPSESQKFDTPQELGEALASVLSDKASSVS